MITRHELVVDFLILGANLLWTMFIYVFAHSMCTGAGTGGNQVLLRCQEYAPWLVFATNVLLFGGMLGIFHILKLAPSYRKPIIRCATVGIFILSFIIWNSPLSLIPVR